MVYNYVCVHIATYSDAKFGCCIIQISPIGMGRIRNNFCRIFISLLTATTLVNWFLYTSNGYLNNSNTITVKKFDLKLSGESDRPNSGRVSTFPRTEDTGRIESRRGNNTKCEPSKSVFQKMNHNSLDSVKGAGSGKQSDEGKRGRLPPFVKGAGSNGTEGVTDMVQRFVGRRLQQAVIQHDVCLENSCKNLGVCVPKEDMTSNQMKFSCNCPEGFYGDFCQFG